MLQIFFGFTMISVVPVSVFIAIAVVSAILLLLLLITSYFPVNIRKPGIIHQIGTSYLGVIVIAMGVQFAFTGFKNFMR